ncbi:MAG: class I SAM-dependent methyltransferase [Caulobacter sp.]
MSPSDQIISLYERHALAYDGDRGRSLMEREWLDRFLAVPPAGSPILDLGCGSGDPMARYLIKAGHPLTGVDSAPSLIALCRKRFPDQAWVTADMRGLDLGQRFGGILAWDSFFHLTQADQRAMFAVFRNHAAPGAALMFTSGPAAAEIMGEYRGEPLHHASLDAAEYEDLLSRHGFEVLQHIVEDADCGGHTVWLARFANLNKKA